MLTKRQLITAITIGSLSIISAGAGIKAAGTAQTSDVPERVATVADTGALEAANDALRNGKLELARLLAYKAVTADPGNTEAAAVFAQVAIRRAADFSDRDQHLAAAQSLQDARTVLAQTRDKSLGSGNIAESMTICATLVTIDRELTQAESELRMDVERKSLQRIRRADDLAQSAHHRFAFNDRKTVRDALRELYYVHERFALAGTWLQGEQVRAVSRLHDLVSDGEWDALRASAGLATPDEKP